MKFILIILFAFVISSPVDSFAFNIRSSDVPTTAAGLQSLSLIKVDEFIKLSPADLVTLTGKKLNTWDKISFHFLKTRMKRSLKHDPNLTIADYFSTHKISPRESSLASGLTILFAAVILLIIIGIIVLISKN